MCPIYRINPNLQPLPTTSYIQDPPRIDIGPKMMTVVVVPPSLSPFMYKDKEGSGGVSNQEEVFVSHNSCKSGV